MLTELNEFIERHKENPQALKAIERFMTECSIYVSASAKALARETIEGVKCAQADIRSLEDACHEAVNYGFSMPGGMSLPDAASEICTELFAKRRA